MSAIVYDGRSMTTTMTTEIMLHDPNSIGLDGVSEHKNGAAGTGGSGLCVHCANGNLMFKIKRHVSNLLNSKRFDTEIIRNCCIDDQISS
jgi:hypothetical protein